MPVALQDPAAYHKRGRILSYDDPEQVNFGDFPGGLKDLATENPTVRQAMIDVYTNWATQIDFDGFRIDTVKHVEHGFWNEFCTALRTAQKARGKKQFVMFGEVFDGNDQLVGSYSQNNELDTPVNFPAKYQVFEDLVANNKYPTRKFETYWDGRTANWSAVPSPNGPTQSALDLPFNFLDNHDVPRFASLSPSVAATEQALFLLMMMPGVPVLYYGTEQGFNGTNDPSNREDLWTSNYNQKHPMYLWIQQITNWRKQYASLRHGTMEFRWLSDRQGTGEDIGIIAFTRTTPGDIVLVVINTSDGGSSSTSFEGNLMPTGLPPGTVLIDQVGGGTPQIVDENGNLELHLSARQNMLLVPTGQ